MNRAARNMWLAAGTFLIATLWQMSAAKAMDPPQERPILTVGGNISQSNSANGVQFDMAMLQALPQHTVTTNHPWTDSAKTYVGPKLSDVLKAVGANSQQLALRALNDYTVQLDFAAVNKFDPILAWQEDGKRMRVRNHGPLWLMLPLDDYKELQKSKYNDLMIWQLASIKVK